MSDPASAATPAPLHPLLARLEHHHGYPELNAEMLDDFCADPIDSVLLFAGDPAKHPETLDVAAILPELAAAFGGRLRPAFLRHQNATALQPRYGFTRWPALVFVRSGHYVGAIGGVRNWSEYLVEIERLLRSEPARAPTIGIAVSAAGDAAGMPLIAPGEERHR